MIFYLKYKQLKEEVKKVEKENKMLRIKLSHTTKLRKQNIENHKLKKKSMIYVNMLEKILKRLLIIKYCFIILLLMELYVYF